MQLANVRAAIANVKGGSFLGMDTITKVDLRGGKKNPQLGRVTKKVTGSNVMIFTNQTGSAYDKMVRRRLEQEGKDPETFQLSPRAFGTRLPNTPFVEHNGKYYLEVIFMKAGAVEYLLDGQPIDKNNIIGLPPPAAAGGEQGGLDNKVVIRTYAIDSIVSLRINNQTYA